MVTFEDVRPTPIITNTGGLDFWTDICSFARRTFLLTYLLLPFVLVTLFTYSMHECSNFSGE